MKTYLFNLKQRKQLSSGRQVDRGGWKGLEAQEGHAPARLLEYEDYSWNVFKSGWGIYFVSCINNGHNFELINSCQASPEHEIHIPWLYQFLDVISVLVVYKPGVFHFLAIMKWKYTIKGFFLKMWICTNYQILTLEYACLSVRPSVRVRDRKNGLTHYPLLLRSWIAANTLSKGWIVC